MANTNIPEYDCPELLVDAHDMQKYYEVMNEVSFCAKILSCL